MEKFLRIITLVSFIITLLHAANRPFPQEIDFSNCIKPNNVTQSQMNSNITTLYNYYKTQYLKSYDSDKYYIEATGNGEGSEASLTISEAHGYGMIIFALMAGYDQNAQTYFDGMYNFFKSWNSKANSYLMSWIAGNVSKSNSATDGDMDIAYALLLADKQWGSKGSINYLETAKNMINYGIKVDDMSTISNRVMLGDWDKNDYTTRSSDWMTGHLRAFKEATGDSFWDNAVTEIYSLVNEITASYSPNTGLMPDFIAGSTPYPDETGGGTNENNANQYWYNACRFPWRIALDFAHNGSQDAKNATAKILGWLRNKTGGDANNIKAGYTLSGSSIGSYSDLVFTAPFAAGAITDAANQNFLNSLWNEIKNETGSNEYALALNMLSMLLISGNWWAPTELAYIKPTKITLSSNTIKENKPANSFIGKLGTDGNGAPFVYNLTSISNDFYISHDSLFSKREFTSATDEILSITAEVTDNQNHTVQESFTIKVLEASENPILDMNWWIEHDTYGTTCIDTGISLIDDSSIVVDFTLGRSTASQGKYVWASLISNNIEGLSKAKSITISYKSNNNYALAIPMNHISDYDYYNADLPNTQGNWNDITLTLDNQTFAQSLGYNPKTFDLTKVKTISFDSRFEQNSGLFEISKISFDSSTAISSYTGNSLYSGIKASIINGELQLNISEKGNYRVSFHSINGKTLYSSLKKLEKGFNIVKMDNIKISNQFVLIKISGEKGSTNLKMLLK